MPNNLYIYQINNAIDFIKANLKHKISLSDIAATTCFSQYHFHRIFKSITKMNVNEFVKREKMEYALRILRYNKNELIKNIAFDLGYSSTANFSRDFKKYFNMSPDQAMKQDYSPYPRLVNNNESFSLNFIDVISLAEQIVYYKRIKGYDTQKIIGGFSELLEFVKSNNISSFIDYYIGIAHDDPEITGDDDSIYDAGFCINQNSDIKKIDGLNVCAIPAASYAQFEFVGELYHLHNAWDMIYETWLCESEYLPNNIPNLEAFRILGQEENNVFTVQLYMAIKK